MSTKAFWGARKKGFEARRAGKPKVSPYGDTRTDRGSVTFSRAFHRVWIEGWEAADTADKEMEETHGG
jgi:hypothetical protein